MTSFIFRISAVCALVLSLSACITNVRTTVSTYQGENRLPTSASFVILPKDKTEQHFDELEFRYFATRLEKQLIDMGFKTAAADHASHRMFLQYDASRQKKTTNRSRAQLHSAVGYRYRYGSVVVVDHNEYDQFEYARRIKLTVEQNTDEPEKTVSLAAVSYGHCEHLASVYDEMITAILANLYSENGSITPEKVSTSRPCSGDR